MPINSAATSDRLCRKPIAGAGVGLRTPHVAEILSTRPDVPWFEVLTDNYFCDGGIPHLELVAIRELYPITMHSVGLSIGSTDPIDMDYLKRLRELKHIYQPAMLSEHLCWTSAHGHQFHDLLPLPYNLETVKHVAERLAVVQDFLGERILIENVSSYLSYKDSDMSEAEFISAVAEAADCYILLDINNIYVSAKNHGFDARAYLNQVSDTRVKQIHLGGHEVREHFILDAHNAPVCSEVWELYDLFISKVKSVPTLIEWDNDLPPFAELLSQVKMAEKYLDAQSA